MPQDMTRNHIDSLPYRFQELVDIPALSRMLNRLYEVAGIPSAIIDMDGNILTWSGSERICELYRGNPEAQKVCIASDTHIREEIKNGKPYAIYKCPHGLVDSCAPIIIEGVHLANVFTGQMLHEPLDDEAIEGHKQLARQYGFDEDEYLDALREVRIFPLAKHKAILEFLTLLAGQIAKMGLTNLRIREQSEKLSESEEKYRELVENTNDLITVVDENGKFSYLNHKAEEVFGLSVEQLLGRESFGFIHPADQAETEKWFSNCLSQRLQVGTCENRQVNQQTGESRHMLWTGNFHYDDFGAISHISGIAHDITAQKRADNIMQILVESTTGRIGQAYFDNMVHKLCELLGCECAILGKIIDAATVKAIAMELDGKLRADYTYKLPGSPCERASENGFCHFEEGICQLFPRDLDLVGMQAVGYVGVPVIDISGNCIGILCAISRHKLRLPRNAKAIMEILAARTAAEIERLEAESAKTELEDQLRQAHKMEAIGTLAGGIAHDFNNILAGIIGYAELAAYKMPKATPERHYIEEVLNAGHRAKELVKQILAFSRHSEQNKEPVSIEPLLKEVLKLLRASTPATIEIQQDIGAQIGNILADAIQVHQVIMNLCTNAVYAMEADGGILGVSLQRSVLSEKDLPNFPGQNAGSYIKLSVSDTGAGISREDLGKIFDPYFTTKGVGKGTGMGLSVVLGIVNSYDGGIAVNSKLGEGTHFDVYFPEVAKIPQEEPGEDDIITTGDERILVVDDEELVASVTERRLKILGYRAAFITSSEKALDLFRADPTQFDLILSDQTMPGLTGKQMARELRQIRADIPIIICTGYSTNIDAESAAAAGINAFLMKPVDKHELAQTIRQVLDAAASAGK